MQMESAQLPQLNLNTSMNAEQRLTVMESLLVAETTLLFAVR
jgi:hypothetical protein